VCTNNSQEPTVDDEIEVPCCRLPVSIWRFIKVCYKVILNKVGR